MYSACSRSPVSRRRVALPRAGPSPPLRAGQSHLVFSQDLQDLQDLRVGVQLVDQDPRRRVPAA